MVLYIKHSTLFYPKKKFMPTLEIIQLTKKFQSGWWPFSASHTYTAVDNISFSLKKGEILGFLGPNGAGKTTTIQMLLGTLTPTSGTIRYFDLDFTTHRIASLNNIGYASGYEKLPSRLTVTENLDIIGRIYGISQPLRHQRISTLLKFFNIWHLRNRQAGTLSAGQATRVMLTKAFIKNPKIVLLDEPTASLDPDVAHEVRQFILTQRKEHDTSILITSHNMDEVTELCDRVLVLKNGSIIANNSPAELAQSMGKVKLHLTITHNNNLALSYLQNTNTTYSIQDNNITININEHDISTLLTQLNAYNIIYSHIAINKPTLEDYFLSIAKK